MNSKQKIQEDTVNQGRNSLISVLLFRPYTNNLTPKTVFWLTSSWIIIFLMAALEGSVWATIISSYIFPDADYLAKIFLFVIGFFVVFILVWITDASLLFFQKKEGDNKIFAAGILTRIFIIAISLFVTAPFLNMVARSDDIQRARKMQGFDSKEQTLKEDLKIRQSKLTDIANKKMVILNESNIKAAQAERYRIEIMPKMAELAKLRTELSAAKKKKEQAQTEENDRLSKTIKMYEKEIQRVRFELNAALTSFKKNDVTPTAVPPSVVEDDAKKAAELETGIKEISNIILEMKNDAESTDVSADEFSRKYKIVLLENTLGNRWILLREIQRKDQATGVATFESAETLSRALLFLFFASLMAVKLFQPREVDIYFDEALQEAYDQYMSGNFNHPFFAKFSSKDRLSYRDFAENFYEMTESYPEWEAELNKIRQENAINYEKVNHDHHMIEVAEQSKLKIQQLQEAAEIKQKEEYERIKNLEIRNKLEVEKIQQQLDMLRNENTQRLELEKAASLVHIQEKQLNLDRQAAELKKHILENIAKTEGQLEIAKLDAKKEIVIQYDQARHNLYKVEKNIEKEFLILAEAAKNLETKRNIQVSNEAEIQAIARNGWSERQASERRITDEAIQRIKEKNLQDSMVYDLAKNNYQLKQQREHDAHNQNIKNQIKRDNLAFIEEQIANLEGRSEEITNNIAMCNTEIDKLSVVVSEMEEKSRSINFSIGNIPRVREQLHNNLDFLYTHLRQCKSSEAPNSVIQGLEQDIRDTLERIDKLTGGSENNQLKNIHEQIDEIKQKIKSTITHKTVLVKSLEDKEAMLRRWYVARDSIANNH